MDIKSEIIVLTNRQCMLNQGPRASTKVGGGGGGRGNRIHYYTSDINH